jgi:lipoprotein-releasing system permease protein
MATRLIASLAAAHLRARQRATVVSILSVAVGVGFSIAMAALMEGSQIDFIDRIVNTTPHIVMKDEFRTPPVQPVVREFERGAVALAGLKPKDELRGIRNAWARLAEIEAMPGVVAAPILRGSVLMRFGGRDVAASLLGIEPARERRVSNVERDLAAGTLDDLYTSANGVILGDGLADKLGAGLGDTFTVSAPGGAAMKMTVVGIFHSGVVAFDSGEAYALLKKVQVLANRPNVVNEIRMRVDKVRQASEAARRIEARFGYRTESWEEANESVIEVFEIRNVIMYTVVAAIMVVAAFGIFNIVSTITYEKARDIAILSRSVFPRATSAPFS